MTGWQMMKLTQLERKLKQEERKKITPLFDNIENYGYADRRFYRREVSPGRHVYWYVGDDCAVTELSIDDHGNILREHEISECGCSDCREHRW